MVAGAAGAAYGTTRNDGVGYVARWAGSYTVAIVHQVSIPDQLNQCICALGHGVRSPVWDRPKGPELGLRSSNSRRENPGGSRWALFNPEGPRGQ